VLDSKWIWSHSLIVKNELLYLHEVLGMRYIPRPSAEGARGLESLKPSQESLSSQGLIVVGEKEELGGEAGELLKKMLSAIHIEIDKPHGATLLDIEGSEWRLHPENTEGAAVLILGQKSAEKVLKDKIDDLAKLRGALLHIDSRVFLYTFNPSELIESPQAKRLAWEDLKTLRSWVDTYRGGSAGKQDD
jgi:hypothetical protein